MAVICFGAHFFVASSCCYHFALLIELQLDAVVRVERGAAVLHQTRAEKFISAGLRRRSCAFLPGSESFPSLKVARGKSRRCLPGANEP